MHVTDWFPTILDLAGGAMLGLQELGLIGLQGLGGAELVAEARWLGLIGLQGLQEITLELRYWDCDLAHGFQGPCLCIPYTHLVVL